jgi:hypothetical protein
MRACLSSLYVSKLTCSFGLDRLSSSRIHWRAAPMPRVVDVVSESVLRVWKPASVSTSILSRVSDIAVTIASTRGSASGGTVCA